MLLRGLVSFWWGPLLTSARTARELASFCDRSLQRPLTRERTSDPEFSVCGVHCGSLCDVEGGPEVQLLGAGGERHTPGRQVGLRRRSDDTLAHGDADSVWRGAWDHGPAEGAPLSLALPVGSRVPVWANYQKAPWRCTGNSSLHVDLDSLQKVGFCCLCL